MPKPKAAFPLDKFCSPPRHRCYYQKTSGSEIGKLVKFQHGPATVNVETRSQYATVHLNGKADLGSSKRKSGDRPDAIRA